MPLVPKRVKYLKQQRGRKLRGYSKGKLMLTFGEYGLKALESGWITQRQIEAVRLTITRFLKKTGKLWINIFPDKPVTKKPQESRMGRGKGDVDHWVAVVKKGRVMFEIGGLTEEEAKEALRQAASKLPIMTKIVSRTIL
jgi:large subunit ribosomal protein L16